MDTLTVVFTYLLTYLNDRKISQVQFLLFLGAHYNGSANYADAAARWCRAMTLVGSNYIYGFGN